MRFGINMPAFADFSDPRVLAEIAREAEDAGWDGFFIWDHIFFDPTFHPMADPWVALAAVAMRTERIRIGTMITPIARRRPWKLARETVSVDRLSNGRLTLGVGLGDPAQWDFGFFDEATDPKTRAQKLDEGLDILTGLWKAEPFSFQGEQFNVKEVTFRPTPMQTPRIPIWVGGWWPNKPHYDAPHAGTVSAQPNGEARLRLMNGASYWRTFKNTEPATRLLMLCIQGQLQGMIQPRRLRLYGPMRRLASPGGSSRWIPGALAGAMRCRGTHRQLS